MQLEFVDYGSKMQCSKSEVFTLMDEFSAWPHLAHWSRLAGVWSGPGDWGVQAGVRGADPGPAGQVPGRGSTWRVGGEGGNTRGDSGDIVRQVSGRVLLRSGGPVLIQHLLHAVLQLLQLGAES